MRVDAGLEIDWWREVVLFARFPRCEGQLASGKKRFFVDCIRGS